MTGGVDHDPRPNGRAVAAEQGRRSIGAAHDRADRRGHHAIAHRGEQARLQRVVVEHGVGPSEGVAAGTDGDDVVPALAQAVVDAEPLRLVDPAAVGRTPARRRLGRDEHDVDAANGALGGDRQTSRPGADDGHVVRGGSGAVPGPAVAAQVRPSSVAMRRNCSTMSGPRCAGSSWR